MEVSAFVATRRDAPSMVVAPIIDDITMNESLNDGSPVLFKDTGDVIDSEQMVGKQVANCQSPFGGRVESCAVRRQGKRFLTYQKTITGFRVEFLRCPSQFKKPRSHVIEASKSRVP